MELGPLSAIASQPGVTDIAVTCDGTVWADCGQGMQEVCLLRRCFPSAQSIREFAVRLCSQLGRRLDDACPIADASTVDGLRVHAVIAQLVPQGAAISIRLPDAVSPNLESLARNGMFPAEWLPLLAGLVSRKASVLVTGGTGNLLGDEQSGHIEGVGFDLYVRMVSEAVEKYKEPEENVEPVAVSIDLPIEASIPIEYIDSDKLRLEAYRKLASVRNEADLKDLEEELTDRYGKPPVEFETLFDVARLKFKARKLGISEILAQSNRVRIGRIDPPESIQMRMGRIYKGTQYRPVTHQLIVPTPFTGSLGQGPMSSDQVVLWTNQLLDDLAWTPSSSKRQSRL